MPIKIYYSCNNDSAGEDMNSILINNNDINIDDCIVTKKHFHKNMNEVKKIQDDVLIYVIIGELKIESTSEDQEIQTGNACYLRKGEYIFQYFNDTEQHKTSLFIISFKRDFIKEFLQRHAEIIVSSITNNINSKSIALLKGTSLISQTIDSLYSFQVNKQPLTLFNHKLEELLLLIVHSDSGAELCNMIRNQTTRSSDRLQVFMESHFLNDWRLSEFSKEFGASLTTFKELFHEVYGVSPRAWITERRLLYAYNLLLSSKTRIVDVAMESGFSSQSYFTQSYRKRFGMTPSKVRSEIGMTPD